MSTDPSHTLTPNAAGELLGVSGQTVRRWCLAHADHLSESANPATANTPRLLTPRDVEVLRHVKDLRNTGVTEVNINAALAGLTFPTVVTPTEAAERPQDGQEALQFPALLEDLRSRFDAAQVAAERAQRDRMWVFIVGFAVGIGAMAALVLIMLGLAALAG